MEKDKDSNRHEKDETNEKESFVSKKSSLGSSKSNQENQSDSPEDTSADDKNNKPNSLARFFDNRLKNNVELSESDNAGEDSTIENMNLTEDEVHEATLAIVDGRTQEVYEELTTADPDSSEEFEALADAVFLESLQELAENSDDVTPDMLEQAYRESLEDLLLRQDESDEQNQTQSVNDKPNTLITPPNPPVLSPNTSPSSLNVPIAQSSYLNSSGATQNLNQGRYNSQNFTMSNPGESTSDR